MFSVEKYVWLLLNSNFTKALEGYLPILFGLKHVTDLSKNLTAQEIKFWYPGDLSGRVYSTTSSKLQVFFIQSYISYVLIY